MNCGICNQEMEHLESVGMLCTSCDIKLATDEDTNGIDNLEQEILSALKINRDVNWVEHDANDEFDNLITFVKTLFSRYRGNN